MAVFSALAGWLHFAALVVTIGAVSARALVLRPAGADLGAGASGARRRTASLGMAGAVGVLLGLGLLLLRQFLEFRDPFAPWGEDLALLLSTAWGTAWVTAVAAAVAGAAFLGLARGDRTWAWWLAGAATVVLAAYPAWTGHASGGDAPHVVTVPADILHVLAAGAWMGGLAVVLDLERSRDGWGGDGRASVLPVLVPRFSPMAMGAVATLVVTGTLASWLHIDGLGALVGTAYGRWLLVKLAVVAGVLALGALNWRRLSQGLHSTEGPGALRRAAAVELLLGTLVLLVTAILVRTPPAMGG